MQAETEDRDRAYISEIPPEAEERVIATYPDGAKQEAEYWLDGQRVGVRSFHLTGELRGNSPGRTASGTGPTKEAGGGVGVEGADRSRAPLRVYGRVQGIG